VSDPAFAGYTYLYCHTKEVNEGDSFQISFVHAFSGGNVHGGRHCSYFSTQVGTASTADFVPLAIEERCLDASTTGDVWKPFSFQTKQDNLDEGDETFYVRVFDNEQELEPGKFPYCTITIKDDDYGYSGVPPSWALGSLVSNVTKASGAALSFDHDVAQAFQTGSNAAGYTLTSVDLVLGKGTGTPAYTVTIRSDSGGTPGSSLGTLNNPTLQSGTNNARFTASAPINLAANTWYWVVVDVSTTDSTTSIEGTDSNHQDAATAVVGWTIANGGLSRAASSTTWQARTGKMRLAVHGSTRSAPPQVGTRGLVSNTGRSSDANADFSADYAQAFTTGGNAGGYRLTGADVEMTVVNPSVHGTAASYAVHIYSDGSTASSEKPGISLGTLLLPSAISTGVNQFGTSFGGIDLKPDTKYWVVLDVSSAGNRDPRVVLTNADAEDTGATTGWSIGNAGLSRSGSAWTELASSRALKIAIHADARAPPPAAGGGLVSNMDQASAAALTLAHDVQHLFNTGSNAAGYNLTGVDLALEKGTGSPVFTVTVWTDPNEIVAQWTGQTLGDGGITHFAVPGGGAHLKPNTRYWLIFDVTTADGSATIWGTNANAEDAGAAAGWSIGDGGGNQRAAGTTAWQTRTGNLKMTVHGSAKRPWEGTTDAGALVSNTGQTASSSLLIIDRAQAFSTGGLAVGYTLTGVDLVIGRPSGALGYDVSIRSDASGVPGGTLATLTKPASLPISEETVSFLAPGGGIDLAADTTYWVVFDWTSGSSSPGGFGTTDSNAEDGGRATGWSIADRASIKNAGNWIEFGGATKPRIAIHGHARGASAPPAPNVTVSKTDGTELTVSWEDPGVWPPVTGYEVRYRRKGEAPWTDVAHSGSTLSVTVSGVLQGASFEAQVRARNRLGPGDWGTGTGHTGPARFQSAITNSSGTKIHITLTKSTGTLGDKNLFRPLIGSVKTAAAARWADGVVSLDLASADTIQPGQTVKVTYHAASGSIVPTRDADGFEIASFSSQPVTNATSLAPAAPNAPAVSWPLDSDRLEVSWGAPDDKGSPITDYDLRYFFSTTRNSPPNDADPVWIEPDEEGGIDLVGTATTTTLREITGNGRYFVQVRATNAEGTGPWSTATTTIVGSHPSVTAAPAAPTVDNVANSPNLTVSWTAPFSQSLLVDYDVRYFAGAADPGDEADWVTENETTGLTSANSVAVMRTVTGLAPNTAYQVQVRAANEQGESAWSDSGTATTNASSSTTNTAPVRETASGTSCVTKTADTSHSTLTVPPGSLVSAGPLVTQGTTCGMFHDANGDGTLTFTARVGSVPDDVIFTDGIPNVATPDVGILDGGRVYIEGTAKSTQTDVRVDVTATDEHGASVSTHFIARMGHLANTNGAPTFLSQAPPRHFAQDVEIEPFRLPEATGGDVGYTSSTVSQDYAFSPAYTYEVSGLPPGLNFDPAKLEVSGTPSETGTWTVTYTAGDADQARGGGDKASQTFPIRIGYGPQVHRVRIVSRPSYDADGDGTADTYVRGDKILVDVEFGSEPPTVDADGNTVYGRDEPVEIGGSRANVKLRLDLGPAGRALRLNRKQLSSPKLLHGGETMRFTYTVGTGANCGNTDPPLPSGDCDSDGVWVQTAADSDRVIFLAGTPKPTITHAVTGAPVEPSLAGLPTTGNPRARVDGSKTTADIGPRPTGAAVNGDTLTVTYNKNLNTSVNTEELRRELHVQGAGDVYDLTGHAQYPGAVEIRSSTLTLTLSHPARTGNTVMLSYSGTMLRGTDGKRAPMFNDLAVTNATGAAPSPERALIRAKGGEAGKELVLYFDKTLASSLPAGSAFGVAADDANFDSRGIAGTGTVAVAGSAVTVTLAEALRPGEQADAWYTKPASNPLKGTGTGNPEVASFTGFPVRWIDDDTAPRLLGGAVVAERGGFRTFKAALYFDEELDWTSTPATWDFAVTTVGGSVATVSSAVIAGNNVVLWLERAQGETGTSFVAAYTPGANPIQDEAGNAVAAFSQTLTAAAAGAPVGRTAAVDGVRLELVYDRPLNPQSVPAPGQFTFDYPVYADDRAGYTLNVTAVAVEGSKAVLHLDDPVLPCDGATPFTVSFAEAGGPRLQGLDGTAAAAFSFVDVTNARAVRCDAAWSDTLTVGSIVIRAKRPFATDAPPQASWFTVTASGGPVTVTGAAFSPDDPRELILSLSRELEPGETVTLSYTRPWGTRGLWSADGRQLGNLVNAPVTVPAAEPAALTASFEGVPDGHGGRGNAFSFELRFSENFGGRLDYRVLRDEALQATNARVTGAARVTQGRNDRWTVTVRPRGSGDVTVTLATTADCSAAGAICTPDGRRLSNAPAATVAGPSNRPATGAPAITGTAQVGETLTASTADIADPDGLAGATFAFQWLSNGGGGDADIAGATASTYTLAEADEGRTIKVRATFTDDAGNRETVTSAATRAVAPALPPLTATFVHVPAEHDGKRLFSFELRFSENFPGGLDYRVLRDHAFVVTEGRVREAKRVAQGRNDRWTISVRPSSWKDVVVTLPATTDCAAVGAICTPDGRMLSNTVSATVRGPVTLSVADAQAHEGADAAAEFTVTLGRAASGVVTVDYATRDGTATAGEDYTFTRGTLTFAVGDLRKTVSVPILDDVLDEGSETFTLKLRNARGAAIADAEATGTITNADPLQKMWLSRFGRTVAGHVTEAVSDRLGAPLSGAQVTVGGLSVDLARTGDEAWLRETLTSLAQALGAPAGQEQGGDRGSGPGQSPTLASVPMRELSGRELLLGSAFHLAREGDGGGPGLAAWGRVTVGGFDGAAPAETGSVRIDGEVTTGILGADAEWERLLAGVAVSVSEGEGRFDQPEVDSGTVESTMTTVSPYARFMVNDRVSAWGLAGFGTGDMTIAQAANDRGQPERVTRTDLEMRLGAVGGRGVLMEAGETGGLDLALRADAFVVETEADPVSNEGSTTAQASRVRLALEGSRAFAIGGGVLTPGLELGLRHDGGDAETGTGVEVGGRVSWSDPGSSLSVEARVRALLAHEDSDYREWGASGVVRLAPGARGRGLSFRLAPTWGAPSSGVDRLWSARDARGLAPGGEFGAEQRLEGELGYGLGLFGDRFTGTPNLGAGFSDTAREYRIGWRLTPAVRGDPGFEVNLDVTRREAANPVAGSRPEHGVMLRSAIRW